MRSLQTSNSVTAVSTLQNVAQTHAGGHELAATQSWMAGLQHVQTTDSQPPKNSDLNRIYTHLHVIVIQMSLQSSDLNKVHLMFWFQWNEKDLSEVLGAKLQCRTHKIIHFSNQIIVSSLSV